MRAAVFVISCILCLKKKLLCLCVVEADQEVVALQLKGWWLSVDRVDSVVMLRLCHSKGHPTIEADQGAAAHHPLRGLYSVRS